MLPAPPPPAVVGVVGNDPCAAAKPQNKTKPNKLARQFTERMLLKTAVENQWLAEKRRK